MPSSNKRPDAKGKSTTRTTPRAHESQIAPEVCSQLGSAFVPFPDGDWEEATPAGLLPAVSELRDRFLERVVEPHFENAEQGVYADLHYYHSAGREVGILEKDVSRLQRWLAADAILYADEFRRIAIANAISVEPLSWAYAHIHNVVALFCGCRKETGCACGSFMHAMVVSK